MGCGTRTRGRTAAERREFHGTRGGRSVVSQHDVDSGRVPFTVRRSDGAAPSRTAPAVPLAVGSFFALVVAATGGAAWHQAPLTWDGAYYLFEALDRGRPITPLGRTVNVVLQSPVLAARHLTDDLA